MPQNNFTPPKKNKRDMILGINRYQESVLYPFFVSCLINLGCLIFFVYLIVNDPLFQHGGDYALLFRTPLDGMKIAVLGLGLLIAVMFFVLIYWAYYISNKVLGPYARIVREMDKIILNKRKGPLYVRQGDDMFQDLVQRINAILEKKTDIRIKFVAPEEPLPPSSRSLHPN